MADAPDLDQHFNGWLHEGRRVSAPTLVHFEVPNSLVKYVRSGAISADQSHRMLEAFLNLPLELIDDDRLHIESLELANQIDRFSVYDAHFLAVARRVGAELWTADKGLAAISQRLGLPTRLWSTQGNRI